MNMDRPFPAPDEANEMDIEALAMCVLDRLVCTPEDQRSELVFRDGFVNHHVTHAYQERLRALRPNEATVIRSRQAREVFPDYAQALTEAWSLLEREGLLVPNGNGRGTLISREGHKRHASYRARSEAPGHASSQADVAVPERATSSRPPTAVVLWAHSDPAWAADEKAEWMDSVLSFTHLLREHGIDAELDLFQGHKPVDWARFGPHAIEESDFVLVAVSETWGRAFDGKTGPAENAGALGEANTLRGMFARDHAIFQEQVILVLLPGHNASEIPLELAATATRVEVPALSAEGIEELLRVLHDRPAYPKPPVGPVPALEPRHVGQFSGAVVSAPVPTRQGGAEDELPRRPPDPPALRTHEYPTGTFNLHLPAGPLNAHLRNDGGSTASVLGATLSTFLGDFEGVMWVEERAPLAPERGPTAELERDRALTICFGDGELESLLQSTEPLRLAVRYRAAGRGELCEFRLKLHRAAAAPSARPQWREKDVELVVIG